MPSARRTKIRNRTIAVVFVIAVVLCIAGALALVTARAAMNRGVVDLHHAESAVAPAVVKASPSGALAQAQSAVKSAHGEFSTASNRLTPMSPILEHLGWVPVIGRDLAAAPGLASAARDTSEGVGRLIDGVMPLSNTLESRGGRTQVAPPVLVNLLARGRPDFLQAKMALDRADRTRAGLPRALSPQAQDAIHILRTQLPRLRTLCTGLLLAPRLLGHDGPTSYLVAYEDAHELRATGGFIGSAGLVMMRNGSAAEQQVSVISQRENISLNPPEPVLYYNREVWLFRDSNWAADFPTTADLERFFFNLDYRRNVPNVVDITPTGARYLLDATGPVYLPEYKQTVTGANVEELADFYTHWSSYHGPATTAEGNPFVTTDIQRKQFIQIVARHVLNRLHTLSLSRLVDLGNGLATAVQHKGILLNFRDPALQSLAHDASADGAISQTRHDFLYVVDTNLSYNKINPWVHIHWKYNVTIRPDRWMDDTLTVTLHDGPLPARVLDKGIGPGAGSLGKPSDYADFVRVYVPAGAQLVDQIGWYQPWSSGEVYGKTMFCGYVIVPKDQTRTIRLHYVVPPNGFVGSENRYRLLVPYQPGSVPEGYTVAVKDAATGRSTSWSVQHPQFDVSKAMRIEKLPVHPVPLVLTNVHPIVAANHVIEPHAYLGKPKNQYMFANH